MDGVPARQNPDLVGPIDRAPDMAPKTRRDLTCDDCYFRREGLCALSVNVPCPTFRPTKSSSLTPPRQPQLVPRPSERVTVGRAA